MVVTEEMRSEAVKDFKYAEGTEVYLVSSDGVLKAKIEYISKVVVGDGFKDYLLVFDMKTMGILKMKSISFRGYFSMIFSNEKDAIGYYKELSSGKDDYCNIDRFVIISGLNDVLKLKVNGIELEGITVVYRCCDEYGNKYNIYSSEVNNLASKRFVASSKEEALNIIDYLEDIDNRVNYGGTLECVLVEDVLKLVAMVNPDICDTFKVALDRLKRVNIKSDRLGSIMEQSDCIYSKSNEVLKIKSLDLNIDKLGSDKVNECVDIVFEDTMGFEYKSEYSFKDVYDIINGSNPDIEGTSDIVYEGSEYEVIEGKDTAGDDFMIPYSNMFVFEGN